MEKRYYSRCMYGNYKMDTLEAKSGSEGLKSGSKWIFAAATIIILGIIIGFIGCKPQQTVIQKEEIIWTYKDSITVRDSTVLIPIERYVDIVPIYDTLVLENSISISRSWADTTNHLLRGELKNKNAIQYQIKYVERIVTNDSIVKVELPIPVEVVKTKTPTWAWWTLFICIGFLGFSSWKLYKRFS